MAKTNIIIIALFVVGQVFAQEGRVKRAKEDFDNYAFMDAISSYEDLVEEGYSDEEIFKKLGNANYVNAQYEEASQWYEKLMALPEAKVENDYLYRYAQSLKSSGKYTESDVWMQKLQQAQSDDIRASKFSQNGNYLDVIKRNSGRYTLNNLKINSATSDFAPSFYDKSLVFSTAMDTGTTSRNIHEWNNGSFLNLHSAAISETGELGNSKRFSNTLNTKTHESSSVFTKDGETVYFTRNNSKKGKFARDNKGVSRLKIFRAQLVDGQWTNITELTFNGEAYSVAHPALSDDEKTLYFSSDMPGSLGMSDIFQVAIKEDGNFGEPKNMGSTVNTEARETFPFVNEEVLYFSSDGHPGLGGLDVFAVKLDGSSNQVINLGEPLNGNQDDFSYIINDTGKGYFASNREGGKGSDDIYSFVENTSLQFNCEFSLTGVVKTKENNEVLANAKVIVLYNDAIISETTTDTNGAFTTELDCNKTDYKIVANKEDFQSASLDINLEKERPEDVTLLLPKQVKLLPASGDNLISFLKLNPINFDLNKAVIRADAQYTLNKVVDFLNMNSEIKISVASHTDAKASKTYNLDLSKKRAKATKAYLVSKGIPLDRIEAQGFGEENLLNNCTNWFSCSASENELNRRSEIIVQ